MSVGPTRDDSVRLLAIEAISDGRLVEARNTLDRLISQQKETPGTWRVGRSGTVISDAPHPVRSMDSSDVEYYGGYLICESIACEADARLLAASKELRDAAGKALDHLVVSCPGTRESDAFVMDLLRRALHKAKFGGEAK